MEREEVANDVLHSAEATPFGSHKTVSSIPTSYYDLNDNLYSLIDFFHELKLHLLDREKYKSLELCLHATILKLL
jgi:hypothetical protein